jgi:hypothetical protein
MASFGWRLVGLGALALAAPLAAEAAPAEAAAPTATAPVRVIVCDEPTGPLTSEVAAWLSAVDVAVVLPQDSAACAALERGVRRPTEGADLVIRGRRILEEGRQQVTTQVAFAAVDKIEIDLYGRKFSARLISTSVEFPRRDFANGGAPAASGSAGGGAASPSLPPEGSFIQALVRLASLRHLAAGCASKGNPGAAVCEPLRERALELLVAADDRGVEYFAPQTSAIIKQLRATLILDGACSADTVAGLLRAAARLVPHDADAAAAAAIGRLVETGLSPACLRTTEDELLRSLELDRWNQGRVEDLGRFYELAMNAAPGAADDPRALPSDHAAEVLRKAWDTSAPRAPRVLELGVSAGLSKTVTNDLFQTLVPTAHIEVTFGRDASGFGLRLGATLPSTRELTLNTGSASWLRLILGVGARYRNRVRRLYWEIDSSLLVAPTFAAGHGFDANHDAVGLDGGVGGGGRLGLRVGRMSVWVAAGAAYFFVHHLELQVENQAGTSRLPAVDVTAMLGISAMMWR